MDKKIEDFKNDGVKNQPLDAPKQPSPVRKSPMKPSCSNKLCESQIMVRFGSFKRRGCPEKIQRYRCPRCKTTRSSTTGSPACWEKKPQMNGLLLGLLASKVSMRRCAMLLGVNRKTIHRKLIRFSRVAEGCLNITLQSTRITSLKDEDPEAPSLRHSAVPPSHRQKFKQIVFDEVISKESSKLKPLAIPLLVAHPSRLIIDFDVASMEAQARFKAESEARYGCRVDERATMVTKVLCRSRKYIADQALVLVDKDPLYPELLHKVIPAARPLRIKSRKAHCSGQGELKKVGYDPFFSLNHTAGMMRDSVSRLVRRTWAISRSKDRLRDHLKIYQWFHNEVLLLPKKFQHQRFKDLGTIVSSRVALESINNLVVQFRMAQRRPVPKENTRGNSHVE